MLTCLILTALAATTQLEALYTGALPMDVPTFEVTISGTAPFFAGMQVNGQWIMNHGEDIAPQQQVDFYPDTPYAATQPVRAQMRNVALRYEMPAMRRERLQAFWTQQGYIFIETKQGWIPVRQEDVKLAERARAMAAAAVAQNTSNAALPAPLTAPEAPSPANQGVWLLRLAIIAVGLLLMIAVSVVMLRHKQEWNTLE